MDWALSSSSLLHPVSQPATASATPYLPSSPCTWLSPRAIPAYLRPLAHAAHTILIKLSDIASGQAYKNRPNYLLTEHSVYCLQGPNRISCHRQQPRAHRLISWEADYCRGRVIHLQPLLYSSPLMLAPGLGAPLTFLLRLLFFYARI